MSDAEMIPLGTQVQVSDGTPQPPARFHKKLASWKSNNYLGTVVRHDRYFPGCYVIQRGTHAGGWMVQLSSGVPPEKLTPVEGAPLIPLTEPDGCGDRIIADRIIAE